MVFLILKIIAKHWLFTKGQITFASNYPNRFLILMNITMNMLKPIYTRFLPELILQLIFSKLSRLNPAVLRSS